MIIRLLVIDPRPRKGESDVRHYQLPEKSRELELFQELLDTAGIEHTTMEMKEKPREPRT